MLIGSHESRFTAGQSHFASALRRSTFRQRRNLSSRPASALLSRLADNVSDPILKRALKVHAGDPARSCWLFCPQSLPAMSLSLQKFHARPSGLAGACCLLGWLHSRRFGTQFVRGPAAKLD